MLVLISVEISMAKFGTNYNRFCSSYVPWLNINNMKKMNSIVQLQKWVTVTWRIFIPHRHCQVRMVYSTGSHCVTWTAVSQIEMAVDSYLYKLTVSGPMQLKTEPNLTLENLENWTLKILKFHKFTMQDALQLPIDNGFTDSLSYQAIYFFNLKMKIFIHHNLQPC